MYMSGLSQQDHPEVVVATSGRSSCQTCGESILKGENRVGMVGRSSGVSCMKAIPAPCGETLSARHPAIPSPPSRARPRTRLPAAKRLRTPPHAHAFLPPHPSVDAPAVFRAQHAHRVRAYGPRAVQRGPRWRSDRQRRAAPADADDEDLVRRRSRRKGAPALRLSSGPCPAAAASWHAAFVRWRRSQLRA